LLSITRPIAIGTDYHKSSNNNQAVWENTMSMGTVKCAVQCKDFVPGMGKVL